MVEATNNQESNVLFSGYGNAIEGESDNGGAFYEGEHVDALDTINKWCNAEVRQVEGDRVFVHYTGFVAKYDEWLAANVGENEKCRI